MQDHPWALLETWLGSGLFEGLGEGRRVSLVLKYQWKPLHLSGSDVCRILIPLSVSLSLELNSVLEGDLEPNWARMLPGDLQPSHIWSSPSCSQAKTPAGPHPALPQEVGPWLWILSPYTWSPRSSQQASRKTKKKEGGALRAQRASSNVFSNFEQTQIQEFKEAFTLMDQNRDGFIDKEDLKDTYASLGKTNVKDDELDAMLREASGPINFTMFLNLFGEKLTGTDTEETILNAFKMLDPDGKGSIHKEYIKRLLMSQADKMTATEVDQMLEFASIDAAGNLDYKALSYVLTHGEEKEE
ncbi:myosin light chain 5 isoform X2 [Marmota monax]|uniref:myosin light chain 5 isoform X2 n=3 Tax=Marmota TaxID=9992 RepID=UPI0026F3370E|nr:myosin light chain 5 isoform X2 [Marmota monax]